MPRHSTRPRSTPARDIPDLADLPAGQRERRERIVDAAVAMMVEVDYADIAVRDIAERAGVALGTLYRYFGSKDHLMACALLAWSSGFADRITHDQPPRAVDRLRAVYGRAARAFEKEPRVFDALMQIQASGDARAADGFADFARNQTAAFGAALSDLPAETRDDIVDIMSAVLTESLRSCQRGQTSHAGVRRRIERTAELLLGP